MAAITGSIQIPQTMLKRWQKKTKRMTIPRERERGRREGEERERGRRERGGGEREGGGIKGDNIL